MFPSSSNNQNTRNNLFNNNTSNTLLRGSNDQAHQSYIKQLLGYIDESQRGQQLHWAIKLFENQYRQILAGMEECAKIQGTITYDEQFNKQMRERCLKMKKDNEIIMTEMLNFKNIIEKVKANSIEKDAAKENEFSAVQEEIRRKKMDVVGKLQKLRTNRKASKAKNNLKTTTKKKVNLAPTMKLALTQLKDAVEVVSRELIKQREEIKILIKQLYDEDI